MNNNKVQNIFQFKLVWNIQNSISKDLNSQSIIDLKIGYSARLSSAILSQSYKYIAMWISKEPSNIVYIDLNKKLKKHQKKSDPKLDRSMKKKPTKKDAILDLIKETPKAREARIAASANGVKIRSKAWGGKPDAKAERKKKKKINRDDL